MIQPSFHLRRRCACPPPLTRRVIVALTRGICLFLVSSALGASAPGTARTTPVAQLKRLTLEELLTLDVTSVSRRHEQFSAAASALSLVTGDDIRRSGATTLADALRFSTGLQVARIDGRTWGVASRGFNLNSSNKLLVLLDGRSLYTPLFSGVLWDVQDTEFADLDRIEVVRGPGATLWGANAVNGVISIHTKPAHQTVGTVVTAGGGTEDRQFASLRHGQLIGEGVYARVYAKQYHRDGLILANGADANDDARMAQAGFRIDRERATSPNTWTVQGDIYHGFLGALTGPDSRVAGGNILGRWGHAFDPTHSLRLQTYYDRVERFVPGQFREWRDTFDADLQFNAAINPAHFVVTGIAARTSDDRTGTRGTIRFKPRDRRMTVVSGFVQDELRFLDQRLSVIGGAKFEHNNSTDFEFQPSVRAAWRPNPQHTTWAAISRAVRTPSRFDDDLNFVLPSGVTVVRGDPSFRSENLIAYEAGYRVHPRQNWAVDLSLFVNRYDDLRTQERNTPPGALSVLANQLDADTYGGELTVTAQLTNAWRLRGTYTHLRKDLTFDAGSTDPTLGAQEGNDPKHHWTLVSTWDLARSWEVDALLRHVASLPRPAVPAYTELDIHLAWRPGQRWELAVVGQNLLDRAHREFGVGGPTARELQRSVHGKITWRF